MRSAGTVSAPLDASTRGLAELCDLLLLRFVSSSPRLGEPVRGDVDQRRRPAPGSVSSRRPPARRHRPQCTASSGSIGRWNVTRSPAGLDTRDIARVSHEPRVHASLRRQDEPAFRGNASVPNPLVVTGADYRIASWRSGAVNALGLRLGTAGQRCATCGVLPPSAGQAGVS
jgi:hypothetical protein